MDEYPLILSAQRGEKEAFQSLITLYYPYVLKFLTKLCGDQALSEDLTQDTFLKLIRGIERFDINGKAAFSTWVVTIAKNCYLDYMRRNRQMLCSLEEPYGMSAAHGPNEAIDRQVMNRLQTEEALKALDRLPPDQAAAIRLKYLEQQTLNEIAEKQRCEPQTVKSRIHNGLVKLRKILKGPYDNGE